MSDLKERSLNEIQVLRAISSAGGGSNWLTAPDIARVSQSEGRSLNAPNIYRVLSRLRNEVEYRTVKGIRRFHLKEAGIQFLGLQVIGGPQFVQPGTPWSTQRQLKIFLKNKTEDFLLIVDPYISETTLDLLEYVNVPIQIISAQLGRKGKEEEFLRTFKQFKIEKNGAVDLRQRPHGDLHGRYIVTKNGGWVVDHSLQDLGTKPALIFPMHLDNVFNQVKAHFTSLHSTGVLVS